MAFIASSLDDDSIPANARVWDFVMPPESCWTIPLSSECVSAQAVVPKPSDLLYKSSVQRHHSSFGFRHVLANSSIVESSRSSRAAAVFSSRCFIFEVPGIGSITGDFLSSHASATCAG
jgi:hypothetical protein